MVYYEIYKERIVLFRPNNHAQMFSIILFFVHQVFGLRIVLLGLFCFI